MKKLLPLLFLVGCMTAPPKFTQKEDAVQFKRDSYTLVGCEPVGVLKEKVPDFLLYKETRNVTEDALRGPAAAMGANVVIVIKDATFGETAFGKAYNCK
jgi:hypothetical protein